MLVSQGTTSTVALAILILINAVANGSVIALSRDATRRRCEADARRAATRARRAGAPRATESPAPSSSARRPFSVGVAIVAPVWRRSPPDVVDAEIVP
jgi:hypothetical protein